MTETLLSESKTSRLMLVDESEWGMPVIKKILNDDFPSAHEVSRFYNEYEISKEFDIHGVRKPLKAGMENNRHVIYLEYVDGVPVKNFFSISDSKINVKDFLITATNITNSIGEIHNLRIIHKDICSNNILYNPKDKSIKIIDFGIATKIDLKIKYLGNPERLEGTLSYISPEQTGRMNRYIDYRSDLYSLGIVFYEMLTGSVPWENMDPIELVHCHIAKTPPMVHEINPAVPKVISEIINKLLSKNAEDRYQSAFGLKNDLEKCLNLIEKAGEIEYFNVATNDHSGKFKIFQKLYGREKEVETLLEAFERVSNGAVETMLVSGYSGTGKSALVHEIHKPITQKRGYFIEGKFDQFQRDIPYYAVIQSFKEFVSLLLTENDAKLQNLKEIIQNSVGKLGKVLTDVIPNLELIIGQQPEVPQIGAMEAQNRFNYVFKNFVNAISKKEHPIVLFIDDLQWADSPSLNLINVLMTNKDTQYLLFIGAYRDNEVDPTHPAMITIDEMKKENVVVNDIVIHNLSYQNIDDLINDALNISTAVSKSLADLVYEKTRGNAFFVNRFLTSLYEDSLLTFDFTANVWEWDIEKIKNLNITDNVVELMASKVQKMDEETQKVLKLAACIGNLFDLHSLSVIYEKSVEGTKLSLQPALIEGLISPAGDNFRFVHDRIQQAVYSLIPEKDKKYLHLKIGKLLLEDISKEDWEEKIFDIVNQWNWGIETITDFEEKIKLANLNLEAGKKAKASAAYKPAFNYLQTAVSLLPDDKWKSYYQVTLSLYTELAETAYMIADHEQMEALTGIVIKNATDVLDKVKAYEIRIQAYPAQNKLMEAILSGLEILKELGVNLPDKPKKIQIIVALLGTKIHLIGKKIEDLLHLPEMTDKKSLCAIRILGMMAPPVFIALPDLFPLTVFIQINLSLKHGNTAHSAYAYSTYGLIMTGVTGEYESGYKFGQLALNLVNKFNALEIKAKTSFIYNLFILHWKYPVRQTLQPLSDAYVIGLETGDLQYASYSKAHYSMYSFYAGKELSELEKEIAIYSVTMKQLKLEAALNWMTMTQQVIINLTKYVEQPWLISGKVYEEKIMLPKHLEAKDNNGLLYFFQYKSILAYMFGNYNEALINIKESKKYIESLIGCLYVPEFHFYDSLIRLALYQNLPSSQLPKVMRRVGKNQAKMKSFSKLGGMNFLNKYYLVEAIRSHIKGKKELAISYFDKSISLAKENNFINEEALAYEIAGKFYHQNKMEDLAKIHLQNAYRAYRQWGALAKAKDIENHFPQYITNLQHGQTISKDISNLKSVSSGTVSSVLDLASLMKATTTISGEIVLGKLLEKMMKILIENAGAQNGCLILSKDGKLFIEASSSINEKEIKVLESIPVEGSEMLSESIIHFVSRTKEDLVLNNAMADERFANDTYVIQNKPKSILCFPIITQGKFIGLIYLENKLTIGAFTPERTEVLKLLSGQVAVSIDNAILYENLENKVTERTLEIERQKGLIEREKNISDNLLLNILPYEIAEELKKNGKSAPRKYENVTVMFTDFKGFTQISEKLSPEVLVTKIDNFFGEFDRIMDKHGIEKIKTIGDAYMCVGGLPVENKTHPIDVINAALEIQEYMEQHKKEMSEKDEYYFEIRIGINTGPVVAGVVGTRKFAYDIWGDTVNTASRLESNANVGQINISGKTYELVKDRFKCTYRGKIEAKNKGNIDMYFVERKKDS